MTRKIILAVLTAAGMLYFTQYTIPAQAAGKQNPPPNFPAMDPITKEDRILVFAPHPDDETLGAGGMIQEAVRAGAEARVLYLTNGEHNQLAFIVYEKWLVIKQKALIEMGKMRQREAAAAMKLLGLPEENLIFMGYPDFGSLMIFLRYWGETRPFKNMLTRISNVPYDNALSPNAPYKGEAILWDVESVLRKFRPTRIFVTNPVDTNRDHRAAYLFLQVALWNLKGQIPDPQVYPYVIHCYGWPKPRNYRPYLYLDAPKLLEHSQIRWVWRELTTEEVSNKHRAILLYRSQCSDAASYLVSFARKNELFGTYPVIDLTDETKEDAFSAAAAFREKTVVYGKTDGKLLINVFIKKEPGPNSRFYVNLAGYNPDIEFAQMPKIKINVDGDNVSVLNRGKYIKVKGLETTQKRHYVSLKVPIEILRDPQYVLASVNTHMDNFASDLNAWRVIKLK